MERLKVRTVEPLSIQLVLLTKDRLDQTPLLKRGASSQSLLQVVATFWNGAKPKMQPS